MISISQYLTETFPDSIALGDWLGIRRQSPEKSVERKLEQSKRSVEKPVERKLERLIRK